MESAFKYRLLAVTATPKGHSDLPGRYQSLAASYNDRYRRTGDMQDLKAAHKYSLAALTATPEGHPALPGRHQDLAVSYGDRYRRTGDIQDLEAALKYRLLALSATPEGHPALPKRYQDLAVSYGDRYTRTGNVQDLEATLKYDLAAVTATPEGHPALPGRHHNLAATYSDRYRRSGNMQDLEASLKYCLAALTATPVGHPDLPAWKQSLAASYHDRYMEASNIQDLEDALKYSLEAVTATPEGHPELPLHQHGLAVSYIEKYKKTRDIQHLEASVDYALSAVAGTPEGHPDLPARYMTLSASYLYKCAETGDAKYLTNAHKLYTSALQGSHTAAPQELWEIAVSFTKETQFFGPEVLKGFSWALNILPSLLWLGHPLGARHDIIVINNISSFTSTAVMTALQNGQIQLAIEFFEQGLSMTHQQSLQLKLPHANLEAQLPEQSEKFRQISSLLQGSSRTSHSNHNYHLLAHERQRLIAEIQSHADFEDFLLSSKYSNLCHAASEGPVILLNYTEVQTDAIILLSSTALPIHIALTGISASGVKKQRENLKHALLNLYIPSRNIQHGSRSQRKISLSDYTAAQDALHTVQNWLETCIVDPIFKVLYKVCSMTRWIIHSSQSSLFTEWNF
jgi:hypothetical protein